MIFYYYISTFNETLIFHCSVSILNKTLTFRHSISALTKHSHFTAIHSHFTDSVSTFNESLTFYCSSSILKKSLERLRFHCSNSIFNESFIFHYSIITFNGTLTFQCSISILYKTLYFTSLLARLTKRLHYFYSVSLLNKTDISMNIRMPNETMTFMYMIGKINEILIFHLYITNV